MSSFDDDNDDDGVFNLSFLLNPEATNSPEASEMVDNSATSISPSVGEEISVPSDASGAVSVASTAPSVVNATSGLIVTRSMTVMVAKQNFTAMEPGKLSFKKGDRFDVYAQIEGGWWPARNLESQNEGLIPAYCIAPITPRRGRSSFASSSPSSASLTGVAECFRQSPQRSSKQEQNTNTSPASSLSVPTTLQQHQISSLTSPNALSQPQLTSQQNQRTTLSSSSTVTVQSHLSSLSSSSSSSQSHMTTHQIHQANVAVSAVSSQSLPTTPQSQQTPTSSLQSQAASGQQTSGQQVSQPLTKEHHNAIKVFLIVDQEARPIMKEVFEAGAKSKIPNETLKEYLFRYKGMTNANYRKIFNRTQREKIESDSSCQTFDVSLWLPAIQQGCDGLAPPGDSLWLTSDTLENQLKIIKDFRNHLFHGDLWLASSEFVKKTEEIRTLLLDCLRKTRDKFSLDAYYIEQKINDLNARINFIRDSPLAELNLQMYDNSALLTGLQDILLTKGHEDLLSWFQRLTHVNPASTIVGQEIHVNVNAIFTPLEIVHAGREKRNLTIQYKDLVYEAHKKKQRDGTCVGQIILLEGVAGSGKTTLIKQLLSSWASNQHDVRDVGFYKFIIPIECRSRSYVKLSNAISSLMPTARKSFQNEKIMQECVLDLPSIIILDGLDEMNTVSQELFSEIMEIKNSENLTIICTTRPEKTQDFYHLIPDDLNTMHIKIKGIAEHDIENFIFRYHEALKACGKSKQSTEGLLYYYRTRGIRLKHLFKCPLYSSLMCILWAVAPDILNKVTTETELLLEISNLSLEKLLGRLSKNDSTKHFDADTLKRKMEEFKEFLCKMAFQCLCDKLVILDENAIQALEKKCNALELPKDEVFGAFLNCEKTFTSTGITSQLSFPHKSIQDFYASLYVYGKVTGNDNPKDAELLKDFRESLNRYDIPAHTSQRIMNLSSKELQKCRRKSTGLLHKIFSGKPSVLLKVFKDTFSIDINFYDLTGFQNMFIMLIGIFYHYQNDIDETLAKELLALLRKSGVTDRGQFVQVLNSVKCDETLVRLIAKIPGIMEGTIEVKSHNTFAYASLFKIKKAKNVRIKITEDPSMVPRLDELISSLSNHQCQVECLDLDYLFRHPSASLEQTTLNKAIRQMMKRCPVKWYTGSMFKGLVVSTSVRDLWVSVGNEDSINTLNEFLQSHTLHRLRVCVSADLNHLAMKPLPHWASLYIVDMREDNIQNVLLILKNLQPVTGFKGFGEILFPRCNIPFQHQLDLIHSFERMGIEAFGLHFPSSNAPQQQQQLIREEAKMKLRCRDVYWGGIDRWGFSIDDW